jgi:hypothetical protein
MRRIIFVDKRCRKFGLFLLIPNGFFDIAKSLSYTATRYVSITTDSEVWGFALRATTPHAGVWVLAEGSK